MKTNRTNPKTTNETMHEALERIAMENLGIETLETRKSDRLDFHDLAVWTMKDALVAAYNAGRKASR